MQVKFLLTDEEREINIEDSIIDKDGGNQAFEKALLKIQQNENQLLIDENDGSK